MAHYPATEGLSSTQILALVREQRGALADVPEPLPAELRVAERLPGRRCALAAVHLEGDEEQALGRRRLAFEELLLVQLALLRRRRLRRAGSAAPVLDGEPDAQRALAGRDAAVRAHRRPAARDGGDRRATWPATRPMQRLLMGEVGSGKTVVALYTLLRAVEQGYQGALMAPTEPLAEQHFATIQALMPGEAVPIGLLTGSTPGRRRADLLGKLGSGELSLVVGTHALIEDPVRFASLGRRGGRRAAPLRRAPARGAGRQGAGGRRSPHVLHMTATPIPRTLALSQYGDLDFTVLRELPKGRQPIQTHVCSTERERGPGL